MDMLAKGIIHYDEATWANALFLTIEEHQSNASDALHDAHGAALQRTDCDCGKRRLGAEEDNSRLTFRLGDGKIFVIRDSICEWRDVAVKRTVLFALIIGMLFSLFATALADDTVRVDFDPLPLTGTWVDGVLEENEYHYYPIVLTETGKLSIKYQSFFEYSYAGFLSADLEVIYETYARGTMGAPETYSFEYYLQPGNYYIRCAGNPNSRGEYRIKAEFQALETDEIEPNDNYHEAQAIGDGDAVAGVTTRNDLHDYYCFELTGERAVRIVCNVDNGSGSQTFKLYDPDLVPMTEHYCPQGYVFEDTLKAGVYYIDICTTSADNGIGGYVLKLDLN